MFHHKFASAQPKLARSPIKFYQGYEEEIFKLQIWIKKG